MVKYFYQGKHSFSLAHYLNWIIADGKLTSRASQRGGACSFDRMKLSFFTPLFPIKINSLVPKMFWAEFSLKVEISLVPSS